MSASLPIVLSVASGKNGVSKTNISINLALCLGAEIGRASCRERV